MTGFTTSFLDGALGRVLKVPPVVKSNDVVSTPSFDAPAQRVADAPPGINAVAVLNPFRVYAEGDHMLRGQLNAMDDGQLRTIIRAYSIADPRTVDIANRAELVSLIMVAARHRPA